MMGLGFFLKYMENLFLNLWINWYFKIFIFIYNVFKIFMDIKWVMNSYLDF